ncbi:MAG: hypothetical protein K0R71_568 [Bacillales bacterium]|jgi:putative acetyltransferase|nr:hypothetical protein [Bacillales bacterium]
MDFIIRPVQPGDGEGINALRRMPGVFETILGIPSERIKRNEDFITNAGPNDHVFVAVTTKENGEQLIIGHIGLHVGANPRKRHSASFGLMVHKDYQGMGVGKALLKTIIDIADNWLKLVRVDLTVYVDNEKAIKLYKKFGFEKEGIIRKGSIRNGEYVDEFLMSRIKL